MKDFLIYDLEINKAIAKNEEEKVQGIDYVSKTGQYAWRCFDEMGISVCGAYDYSDEKYHVFLNDNMHKFQDLANDRTPVGFNSISFDDNLCKANGLIIKSWDLLVAIWLAAGLGTRFEYPSHMGYGLDDIAKSNGISGKTGNGALAPVLWQQGKRGKVIDYCLSDVWITKQLLDKVLSGESLVSPKSGLLINVEPPGRAPNGEAFQK